MATATTRQQLVPHIFTDPEQNIYVPVILLYDGILVSFERWGVLVVLDSITRSGHPTDKGQAGIRLLTETKPCQFMVYRNSQYDLFYLMGSYIDLLKRILNGESRVVLPFDLLRAVGEPTIGATTAFLDEFCAHLIYHDRQYPDAPCTHQIYFEERFPRCLRE